MSAKEGKFEMSTFEESVRNRIKERLIREMAIKRAKKRKREREQQHQESGDAPAPKVAKMEFNRTINVQRILSPLVASTSKLDERSANLAGQGNGTCNHTVERSQMRRPVPRYINTNLTDSEDDDSGPRPNDTDPGSDDPSYCSLPSLSEHFLSDSDKENVPPHGRGKVPLKLAGRRKLTQREAQPTYMSQDLFSDDMSSINAQFERAVATRVHDEFHPSENSSPQRKKASDNAHTGSPHTSVKDQENVPNTQKGNGKRPASTEIGNACKRRHTTNGNEGTKRKALCEIGNAKKRQRSKDGSDIEGMGSQKEVDVPVDNPIATMSKATKQWNMQHDEENGEVVVEQAGPRYLRTQFAYIDTEASAAIKLKAATDVMDGKTEKGEELRKKNLLPPLPDSRTPTADELKVITNAILDQILIAAEANGQKHLEKVPSLETLKKVIDRVKTAYQLPDSLCGTMLKQVNGRRNYLVRRIKQGEVAESKRPDKRKKPYVMVEEYGKVRTIVQGDTKYDHAFERSKASCTHMDNFGLFHPVGESAGSPSTLCKHFHRRLTSVTFSHMDVYVLCQEYGNLHDYIHKSDITDLVTENRIPILRNEKLYDIYLSILLGTKLSIGVRQLAVMRLEVFSNALTRLFQSNATRVRTLVDKYRESVQYLVPNPIMLVLLTIDYFEENTTCITHAQIDPNGASEEAIGAVLGDFVRPWELANTAVDAA